MLTLELGSLHGAKRFMERLQNLHGFGEARGPGQPPAPQPAATCFLPLQQKRWRVQHFHHHRTLHAPGAVLPPHPATGLLAVSLGYFDTLMSASAASTSSELSEEELARAGAWAGAEWAQWLLLLLASTA